MTGTTLEALCMADITDFADTLELVVNNMANAVKIAKGFEA
jgi:hypothetical protein